jgi:hypothetical protein
MPGTGPERFLFYVGFVLLLGQASTFPWWAAANIARTEYRSLLSAFACAMRWFFYSICLLCILVAAQSFGWAPKDPKSTLFGWIQIGGMVWISVPSAWRAFRQKGPRLVLAVLIAWALFGLLLVLGVTDRGFRHALFDMPYVFTEAR